MSQTMHQDVAFNNFLEEIESLFDRFTTNEVAKDLGFSQRESPLDGFLFLTTYVFGVAIHGNPSLEQLVGLLNDALEEVSITRQALNKRITEKAVDFFKHMLSQAIKIKFPSVFSLDLLSDFNRVLIIDSTAIELPPHLAEFFKGFGGNASVSALKIQFCYDLKTTGFFLEITEGKKPDNHTDNSFLDSMEAKDLRISDLGYSSSQAFVAIDQKDAYFLSRLKSDLPLYTKDEQGQWIRFDLIQFLKKRPKIPLFEIEVFLKSGETYCATRLIIEPVPESVKNQRLRGLNQDAKKRRKHGKLKTVRNSYKVSTYILPMHPLPFYQLNMLTSCIP